MILWLCIPIVVWWLQRNSWSRRRRISTLLVCSWCYVPFFICTCRIMFCQPLEKILPLHKYGNLFLSGHYLELSPMKKRLGKFIFLILWCLFWRITITPCRFQGETIVYMFCLLSPLLSFDPVGKIILKKKIVILIFTSFSTHEQCSILLVSLWFE